jgi:hypothetical protein
MLMVETNGWNQLDHGRREITARDRLPPAMDDGLSWIAGGKS